MPRLRPIHVEFTDAYDATRRVLGVVGFGGEAGADIDAPQIHVALHGHPTAEMWTSALPIEAGHAGDIQYAFNDAVLFAAVQRPVRDDALFEQDIEKLYADIFALTQSAGFPHLLRMWNYFPGIHAEHGGLDRYQLFCRGRQRAFIAHGVEHEQDFPAATVIGTERGNICLYFLAARTPGASLENPRQVSAYRYPPQYGPASPTFSRSTLKHWDGTSHLYISGTASIVGHESQHRQQLQAQLDEILRNLQALVAHANEVEHTSFDLAAAALLKIYVRKRADIDAVRKCVAQALPAAQMLFCVGDICRSELLVEIEAVVITTRGD